MKKFKKYVVFLVILLILSSSLRVFPTYAHEDDTIEMFSFKTINGYYLCAEEGGGSTLTADRQDIGSWEKFQLIDRGKGYVAIKSYNGYYLQALKDEENILVKANKIGKSQEFKLIKLDNDKFALRTYYGKYVCAVDGGGGKVVADRKNIGQWESFELIKSYKDKSDQKSTINLNAKPVDDSINLSWNKPKYSSNIIGYNIYRGNSSGKQSSSPITDFPITSTSYGDKNIESNKTYYYVLRPVYRDKSLGEFSNEVSAKLSFGKTIVLQVGSRYMYVNEKKIEIDPGKNTELIIKDGRTFLPIRSAVEAMGGEVTWNQSNKKVSIYLNKDRIDLWIGSKTAKVNGVSKETDVAPYISTSNRTMLPLRFIVENLDCDVDWDGLTKRVTIVTKK